MRAFFRKSQPRNADEAALVADDRYDQSIDRTTIQDRARSTFDKAVADIETKMARTKMSTNANAMDADEDDIFPGAAKDMGAGMRRWIPMIECIRRMIFDFRG
jgi:hypothetical protein